MITFTFIEMSFGSCLGGVYHQQMLCCVENDFDLNACVLPLSCKTSFPCRKTPTFMYVQI